MRRLLKNIRTSTFVRYALSYISLLALILTVLFGYMYVYVENQVRDRALDNHINRLSRVVYQHEDDVNTMLNTAMQMNLSPFIEPFSYTQEPARAYDLLRQLAPYTLTNSFCDQMYLCFLEDGHIYSSASSMTLDMFTSLMQYENVSPEELRRLIREPGKMTILPAQQVESTLIDGSNVRIVTFLMSLDANPRTSGGTMIYLVKESMYAKLFSDVVEDRNNTYIFYKGQVLAQAEDFDLPADAVLHASQDAAESGVGQLNYHGENYTLLSMNGCDWAMQYVTILRTADLTASVWNGLSRILVLLSALTAVGVLAALVLAQRNVRPLREISSMLAEPRNGADELASIQTGIRELSARNSDLTTRLERSLPMQRHDFILRFMKGRYATREEAAMAAAGLGMMIDRPYYAVVFSGAQDINDQPLDLRRPPFDSLKGTFGCGVELVSLKAHMYLIFSDSPDAIRRMAEMIRTAWLERSGHAMVALSCIQTDFACAPSAYLEAASAYDNRFVMDENSLLDYSAISTSIEDILPQARKITDGINQALLLRNREMLSGKIEELLHFLKHTNMSPFAFRLIYNDVIATLLRERTQSFTVGSDVQEYYDIFSLSSCQSVDDLDDMLRRMCDGILSAESESPVPQEEPGAIDQVVRYMSDHFADPELSISAIAEAFEMPTARLSLAFKELTRMSPLEYLTLLRVEHSKTLLSGTEKSIKEIAAEVGYYDASSFIRRFKQMTGATPLQYRRSKEEGDHATHADS